MDGQVIERAASVGESSRPGPAPGPVRRAAAWMIAHPLIAIALLAFSVRFTVAAFVAILSGGTLFGDDARYLLLAHQVADDDTSGWTPYEHELYWRTGSLLWPVTGLFEVFGKATFLAQLYVVALGSATAVLTTKLGLSFLSRPLALFAGAIMALLPSQILWSSIVMKDAVVWFLLVGVAVAIVAAQRARGWRLGGYGLAIVAMVVGLGFLRPHTLQIALVALLLASALGPVQGRLIRIAGAAAILVCVPIAFGMGIAGVSFVSEQGSLADRRANNAVGAETAVVAPTPSAFDVPEVEEAGPQGDSDGARGQTAAPGGPRGQPASPADPLVADEPVREPEESLLHYAPKGLTVITLRPYPWEAATSRAAGIRLAAVEALFWYAALALAAIGLTRVRGRLRYMAFPLLAGGATMLMYALTEGNIGTAYRHRGEFVWVIALLAAIGLERIVRRHSASRERRAVAA